MLDKGYVLDEKYEVMDILGKGGMGTVYLCKNIRLENLWAVKEVTKDSQMNVDFLSEPNILKKLNHPGIPRIVDIFYENNNLYMVQDYIQGQTLKECVKQNGIMEKEKVCNITSSLCDIIAYLHGLSPSIIYRDLKPANIIITPDEKVVLIDFGISRVYKEDRDDDTVYMGSNGYAAPEQYGSGQSCKQTDIYGIGMVMYHMTTGKVPSTHLEPLVDDNYINVDDNLRRIIQKCAQIDIKDRYSSAVELKNEITHFMKEDIYEKTVFLNHPSENINPAANYSSTKYMAAENMATKGSNVKKNGRPKLKRSVVGLLILAMIILTIIYLFYRSGDSKSSDVTSSPTVGNSSENIPTSQQNSVDKTKEDKTGDGSGLTNNGSVKNNTAGQVNVNKDSSAKTDTNPQVNSKNDEKKDDQSKEKGKSEGKKKPPKNKHDDEGHD